MVPTPLPLMLFAVMVASTVQRNITARPGENVTLPCSAAENQHLLVVKWSITDLGSEYILLYRDEQFDPDYQSASFKDRVDLKDVDHGDLSLILSNVTINDTGTYKCWVVYKDGNKKITTLSKEPISTINLRVEPRNKDGGQDEEAKADGANKIRLIVGLVVAAAAAVLLLVAVAVFGRQRRQSSSADANPPAEELQCMTSEL